MMKNNKEEYEYVPKPKVHCSGCDDFHFTEEVIIEDYSEDYMGRDVVVFCCKKSDSVFRKGIVVL